MATTNPSQSSCQCVVLKSALLKSGFLSLASRTVSLDTEIGGRESLSHDVLVRLRDGEQVLFEGADVSIEETLELWAEHPEFGPRQVS